MPVSRNKRKTRRGRRRKAKQQTRALAREGASTDSVVAVACREAGKPKADPRDYVLVYGTELIDGDGDGRLPLTAAPVVDGVTIDRPVLIHKRRLGEWFGDEAAGLFWKLGKRTKQGTAIRRLIEQANREVKHETPPE